MEWHIFPPLVALQEMPDALQEMPDYGNKTCCASLFKRVLSHYVWVAVKLCSCKTALSKHSVNGVLADVRHPAASGVADLPQV